MGPQCLRSSPRQGTNESSPARRDWVRVILRTQSRKCGVQNERITSLRRRPARSEAERTLKKGISRGYDVTFPLHHLSIGVEFPRMIKSTLGWIIALTMIAAALIGRSQEPPSAPLAHFHHVHLNSTDPKAAINFYTTKLESEKREFAGAEDAVWANKSWLLFTKVNTPPKSEITSAIWHIGWGGGDNMKETYQKQIDSGTRFQTPITDISDQCDGKGGNGRFFFSYIDGPDHALIELNTTAAGITHFGHVHLLSQDPIAAGDWYIKEFGLQRRGQTPPSPEPRFRCGRQTG